MRIIQSYWSGVSDAFEGRTFSDVFSLINMSFYVWSSCVGVFFLILWLCPEQKCEVKADELEQICELGRGAYGVVDKMRHVPSDLIMAVKVSEAFTCLPEAPKLLDHFCFLRFCSSGSGPRWTLRSRRGCWWTWTSPWGQWTVFTPSPSTERSSER